MTIFNSYVSLPEGMGNICAFMVFMGFIKLITGGHHPVGTVDFSWDLMGSYGNLMGHNQY